MSQLVHDDHNGVTPTERVGGTAACHRDKTGLRLAAQLHVRIGLEVEVGHGVMQAAVAHVWALHGKTLNHLEYDARLLIR